MKPFLYVFCTCELVCEYLVLGQAGEPTWDQDQVIAKANKVHAQFGSLSLHDVPSQSLKSQEVGVWTLLMLRYFYS